MHPHKLTQCGNATKYSHMLWRAVAFLHNSNKQETTPRINSSPQHHVQQPDTLMPKSGFTTQIVPVQVSNNVHLQLATLHLP